MTKRALVLSGGGPVGIAWESGVAAGLYKGGVDLREAELIVGTSAGSVVGAQLALGRDPGSLAASHLSGDRSREVARVTTERQGGVPDLTRLMEVMARAADDSRPEEERRREVGRFALDAETMDEETFIAGFGYRLAGAEAWPERDFRCTTIDAQSGEFVVWDAKSGVPLARAVASSCAVPGIYPPITINGRRYYDGGIRSASNADLARGSEVVVVISLIGGTGANADPRAELAKKRLDREVTALKEAGAKTVELLTPDEASREAFGVNLMDARRTQPAAKNGVRQGREAAKRLGTAWKR